MEVEGSNWKGMLGGMRDADITTRPRESSRSSQWLEAATARDAFQVKNGDTFYLDRTGHSEAEAWHDRVCTVEKHLLAWSKCKAQTREDPRGKNTTDCHLVAEKDGITSWMDSRFLL